MTSAPQRNAYTRAAKSIEQSRLAVENMIAATPLDDHYALGLLGPIVAELQNAQGSIDELNRSQYWRNALQIPTA